SASWGDRMERAFFNAGAAPAARDFRTMCYYQSPNRIQSAALPCEQPNSPGPEGNRFHPLGCPTVLCCVGNINRIIPNFIIHMWMATRDNGLAATLYGPSEVTAMVGAGIPVRIDTTTDYPFAETIRMTVMPKGAADFPLYVRIPGWSRDASITVDGARFLAAPNERGFVRIDRKWSGSNVVE